MFHFHYCGNPLHDLVHNALVLLTLAPEWIPLIPHLQRLAREKLSKEHQHTADLGDVQS